MYMYYVLYARARATGFGYLELVTRVSFKFWRVKWQGDMSRTPASRCKSFYGRKVGQNDGQGKAVRGLSQKTSVNNSYRRGMRLDERPENFTITPAAEGGSSDDNGSESEELSQEGDFDFNELSPTVEHSLGGYVKTNTLPPPPHTHTKMTSFGTMIRA